MKNKSGQVTIFIIIALVLVLAIGSYFIFIRGSNQTYVPPYAEEVFVFTQSCIEGNIAKAVKEVSENGGYFYPPIESTEEGVPYYTKNNKFFFPEKENIEHQLSEALSFYILDCVEGFDKINNAEVEYDDPEISSSFGEEVFFNVIFPIRVIKEEEVYELREFGDFKIKSNLLKYYEASYFVISNINFENKMCLSCFSEYSSREKIEINFESYDKILYFILKDKEVLGEGDSQELLFVLEDEN